MYSVNSMWCIVMYLWCLFDCQSVLRAISTHAIHFGDFFCLFLLFHRSHGICYYPGYHFILLHPLLTRHTFLLPHVENSNKPMQNVANVSLYIRINVPLTTICLWKLVITSWTCTFINNIHHQAFIMDSKLK